MSAFSLPENLRVHTLSCRGCGTNACSIEGLGPGRAGSSHSGTPLTAELNEFCIGVSRERGVITLVIGLIYCISPHMETFLPLRTPSISYDLRLKGNGFLSEWSLDLLSEPLFQYCAQRCEKASPLMTGYLLAERERCNNRMLPGDWTLNVPLL